MLLDLGGWIHDHKEAVFGTEKGLDYNHFLGGSTISADKKTMYLFVYDKPQETLCVKGIKTPVKKRRFCIRERSFGSPIRVRFHGAAFREHSGSGPER